MCDFEGSKIVFREGVKKWYFVLNKGGGGPGALNFVCFFGNHFFCTKNTQKCYETYDIVI